MPANNMNAMRGGNHFNFSSPMFSNQASTPHSNQPWPNFDSRSNTPGTDAFFDTCSTSTASGYDNDLRLRILTQATADELKRASNRAYMSLYEDFLKLQGQITGKDETISTLKQLLQQPVVPNTVAIPSEKAPKAGGYPFAVPPSPAECEKEDFEDVKFWTMGEWNEYKSNNPDCGKLEFLTDDSGSKVKKDRLKEMSTEARVLFNELYRYRHDPSTWSTRTAVASAFFSNTMRQKFPAFRWCEGDWKVHAFATARYPNWVADARDRGRLQRECPSINASQKISKKRKVVEDDDDRKKTRKKQKSKALSDDGATFIDLTDKEDMFMASALSSERRDEMPMDPSHMESGFLGMEAVPTGSNTTTITVTSMPLSHGSNSTTTTTVLSATPPHQSNITTSSTATVIDASHRSNMGPGNLTTTTVVDSAAGSNSIARTVINSATPSHGSNTANSTTAIVNSATPVTPIASATTSLTAIQTESPPPSNTETAAAPSTANAAASSLTMTNAATTTPSTSSATTDIDHGDEGLFAGLSIPPPVIEAPATTSREGPENLPPPPRVSAGGKPMVPSEALTPRNLFAIDYVKENPGTTVDQFKEIWKQVERENNETLKTYKSLSTQRRKEAKKSAGAK